MHAGSRTVIFWLQVVYLLALFAIGYLCWSIPNHLWLPEPLRSYPVVPIAVPWFGALGAVLISLTGVIQRTVPGVFDEAARWRTR